MSAPFHRPGNLSRRTFLRGAGVALALPWLEGMRPALGGGPAKEIPRRMVCIETNQGILPDYFYPAAGSDSHMASPYLQKLAPFAKQTTVFSGVSLPGVDGGHAAEKCFLTGTPHPARGGFRNGISLDQLAAEQIGSQTRYPSLVLAVANGHATLSFTRSGAPIPAEASPRKLFEKLFIQGTPDEVAASVDALRQGRSLMDFVSQQSRRLSRTISRRDQQRLDQYFTAVRDLESRLAASQSWEVQPKPVVDAAPPQDISDEREFVKRTELVYNVMRLALQTDSSRVISLFIDTTVIHNLTHHGNRPEVLSELSSHESGQFAALAGFLTSLADCQEEGESLLDRTMVLYGTCMGSANSHTNLNLPVILTGGGFRHGQLLSFDAQNNYPLSNLYVSMLQRLGIEAEQFSTSTGTMRGLELA